MINTLVHILLLLLLPPLIPGVITKTKAFFAGRRGPSIFQPYYDIIRLMRRDMVFSRTTTFIFRLGPIIGLVTALIAGSIIAFIPQSQLFSFSGDIFLFAYLFALGRFFTVAAALDTGSAFEGMGSAREVTFACFSEAALFLALLVLARLSGSLSLGTMLAGSTGAITPNTAAPLVLICIGLYIVMLAENCRIPIDDPTTHLELTMIHEVMVLDHSGPLFGIVEYGSAVKLLVLGSLVMHILLPFWTGTPLDWLIFIAKMLLIAVTIGAVESSMARLRMSHVPYLLGGAILFTGFAFILLVR